MCIRKKIGNLDSSVSVNDQAMDWTTGESDFDSQQEQKFFLHHMQTGSGALLSLLSDTYWGLFPEG
jgi:hypothetical protein